MRAGLAVRGMTTFAVVPMICAAYATAAALFPELNVARPRACSSGDNDKRNVQRARAA